MKKQKLRAEVVKLERLQNSTNGNPKYAVTLENGKTYKTAADAGWVYGVYWEGVEPQAYVEITYHETKSGRLVLDNLQIPLVTKASDLYYSRLWNDETQHIIYR